SVEAFTPMINVSAYANSVSNEIPQSSPWGLLRKVSTEFVLGEEESQDVDQEAEEYEDNDIERRTPKNLIRKTSSRSFKQPQQSQQRLTGNNADLESGPPSHH